VHVTLSLGFGDGAGEVGIRFHRGGSLHRDARGQGQRRSKKKKLPELDGGASGQLANRTGDQGIGYPGGPRLGVLPTTTKK
jgi:hypothetical protein